MFCCLQFCFLPLTSIKIPNHIWPAKRLPPTMKLQPLAWLCSEGPEKREAGVGAGVAVPTDFTVPNQVYPEEGFRNQHFLRNAFRIHATRHALNEPVGPYLPSFSACSTP